MQRRAILLLLTMVVAILLASGIAFAKAITCQVGIACNGTKKPDTITGTESADTIDGRGGKDTIDGKGGGDTINGSGGSDFISGNAGADAITDGGGDDTVDDEVPDGGSVNTDADTLNVTKASTLFNFSDFTGADFVVGRGGSDTFSDLGPGINFTTSALKIDSVLLDFGASDGTDTDDAYILKRRFGHDQVVDRGGANDVLDLRDYSSSEFQGIVSDSNGNGLIDNFIIRLSDGSLVVLEDLLDDTSAEFCSSGPGVGYIEKLRFSDRDFVFECASSGSSLASSAADNASVMGVSKVSDTTEATASIHNKDAATLEDTRKETRG